MDLSSSKLVYLFVCFPLCPGQTVYSSYLIKQTTSKKQICTCFDNKCMIWIHIQEHTSHISWCKLKIWGFGLSVKPKSQKTSSWVCDSGTHWTHSHCCCPGMFKLKHKKILKQDSKSRSKEYKLFLFFQ